MKKTSQLGIALLALLVCFVLVMVYRSSLSSSPAGAPAGGVSTSAPIAVAPHGVTSTIASTVTLIPGMTDTLAVTPTVIQAVTPTPGVTVTLVVTSQATPSPGFTVISRSVADTNAVMAATKDGEPIILTTEVLTERVRLDSGEITWIAPHYRVRVSRAGSVTYLNWRLPGWNEGCTIEMECADWIYSTFATRAKSDFPNGPSRLVDLDGDGEPEILTMWPLDGSGDIWSFHVHRWDGNQYQLLAEASEQRLTAETQDLNGDGRPELIVRFYASPHRFHIPWVDVYALSGDQLVLVNSRYPQFYEELLAEYEVRIPEYTALATALASDGPSDETIEAMKELERRKEMARALVE